MPASARAKLAEQRAAVAPKALAFNICLVTFNEHRVFDNTIRVLHDALLDLGHTCSIKEDQLDAGAINIVIGAVVWRARHGSLEFLKSAPYVLYQFEQLFEHRGVMVEVPEYVATVKSATRIFEYSPSNMKLLKHFGLKDKTIYLPPSFHRSLEMFYPSLSPTIDVLMVGSYSDRRNRIIDQLRQDGRNVAHVFNVYGEELINYMKKTKIVLNIHWADGVNTLEAMRISFALANRSFVISEVGDHNPYGDGIVFADYDTLVATCLEYLGPSADKRASIATEGYLEYRRSDLVTDLRDAIRRMPIDELTGPAPST
jgi:hypothetical protein